jgi:hypothetical protein
MNQRLDAKASGLAFGIMWSFGVLILSLVSLFSETYLHNIADFFSSVYLGYELNLMGIIIGMVWGFFDAFIGGFVLAWLYNKLL